eukprot:scaffold4078_cov68-Phaeocystis_antarctica.AAC.7
MSSLELVAYRDLGCSGGEGGEGKGEGGAGGSGGGSGGEGGEGGDGGDGGDGGSGKGGDDDTWLRMVTAGETNMTAVDLPANAGTLYLELRSAIIKLPSATVRLANFFSRMAVEDELAVLAIS